MKSWGILTGIDGGMGIFTHPETVLVGLLAMVFPVAAPATEPVIDAFSATPAVVKPGETVSLAVQAHDPDCSNVCTSGCGQYIRADLTQWDPGSGTFDSMDNGTSASPYTASAVWRAPSAEGTVTVTITLSDSGTFMCGGRQTASASVVIQVSANAGEAPVITSLTIDHDPVLAGGTAALEAVAEDPQDDPVTFSWSASVGTVTAGTNGAATYHAPPEPGEDVVTCTASDPGGNSSSKTFQVGITAALTETVVENGLVTPHDVTVDLWGDLVVADRGAGGLVVVNPVTGEAIRSFAVPEVTSVAVDWIGRIVVGTRAGLLLVDGSSGTVLGVLDPGVHLGVVSDVTVDTEGQRIWALYGGAGRLVAFDGNGTVVRSWGARGSAAGQFHEPMSLAWSPVGELLVADGGLGQVLVFDPAGGLIRSIGALGGGPDELTRVAGVVVGPAHRVYASDAFQSRVQVYGSDGSFLESLGGFGEGAGRFKVPMGMVILGTPPRLAVASARSSSIQVFRLDQEASEVPEARVDPGTLDFGEVVVGETSNPAVARLTNTGSVPVGLYGLDTPSGFRVTTTCGAGLLPGQSCTATIVFAPFHKGQVLGTLRFLCSGQGEQAVALAGRAVEEAYPLPELSPASIEFQPVVIGATGEVRTVILTNRGGGMVEVERIRLVGTGATQFAVADDGCDGLALGSDESCSVAVVLSPSDPGLHTADLVVETSAGVVSTALSGEALDTTAIPAMGPWGTGLLIGLLAVSGFLGLIRRRAVAGLALVVLLTTAGVALAVDPPHWYFDMDCASCHTGHTAAGGTLTAADGNSNLCLSCHTVGGRASALPIPAPHLLNEHKYNVTPDAPRWGSQMPTNPEMANRIMDGQLVCSTCHDQHSAKASNRGRLRVSTPERLTSFGSTGTVTVGGSYTGSGGSSYLIEISIADQHFRYSKDGGTSWAGEADIGADVPLDNGLTVTFAGGSFALGERWRFSASYPFLRLPLDQGDNTTGDRYCRECHSLWAMDHTAVEGAAGPGSQWLSHPVGESLDANGRGYDRPVPLDGNGAPQGSAGVDGNRSNDYALDAMNMVQCLSCHHIHYADSNTLTEDGP